MNTLNKLVLDLAHIIIGDQITITDDRRAQKQYIKSRLVFWEKLASENPQSAKALTILNDKIHKAYEYIESGSRFANDARMFSRHIFRASIHPKDPLVEEIITYIAVANAIEGNTTFFAEEARTLLEELGCANGLLDENLKELTLYELITKLLEKYAH